MSQNLLSSLIDLEEPGDVKDFSGPSVPLEILVVDEDVAKELQCGICLQILTKPKQCKNGHLFCGVCISKYLEKKSECPQCRCSLKENELSRSLFVERHIRLLKVFCRYHFMFEEGKKGWTEDPEGCFEVCRLEELPKHEKQCGYSFIICPFSPQCEQLRKKDVKRHEKICPFRPLECQHCKLPVESKQMEVHLEQCTMLPIQCIKCDELVARGDMDQHLQNLCLEEMIPCKFSDQGCEARVLRKNLKEHLAEEVGSHLDMMKRAFDHQTEEIKQQMETQLKIRDERVRHLERLLSENVDTRIEWKVKNWSSMKKKTYLQSDKFNFAEFTWFIGFYTDGDNDDSRGYISVYLFLDVANIPKGKNVTIEFVIKFINHKDPQEIVKKEFKTTFPIKGGQGWGDRKAIKASRISEESGFLKQDILYLEAFIQQKRVHWTLQ